MLRLLRNRPFGLLFAAQLVSLAGDFALFVGLPFWVYALTDSATATGLVFTAALLPRLALSSIAGVFVDRWDRRRTMLASDVLRAGLLLPLLAVNTADMVPLVYVVAFAQSCVSIFFRPAQTALLPTIVPAADLTRANAAMNTAEAVARLGGPAMGGAVFALGGGHAVVLVDVASFLASAGALWLLSVPAFVAATAAPRWGAVESVVRELLEGGAIVVQRPALRAAIGGMAIFMVSEGVLQVLLVPLVTRVWSAGSTELGWLLSVEGLGALLGGVFLTSLGARFSPRVLAGTGGIAYGVVIGAVVNQPSVWIAIALMSVSGMAIAALNVGVGTLIQRDSDSANRGRVAALLGTLIALAELVGMGTTALLADSLGPVALLDAAALAMCIGGGVMLLARARYAPESMSETPRWRANVSRAD